MTKFDDSLDARKALTDQTLEQIESELLDDRRAIGPSELEAQRQVLVTHTLPERVGMPEGVLETKLQAPGASSQALTRQNAEQMAAAGSVSRNVEMMERLLEATETKLCLSEAHRQALVHETAAHVARVETLGKQLAQSDQKIQELDVQRRAFEDGASVLNARLAETEMKLRESEARGHALGERHTDQMSAAEANIQVLQEQLKQAQAKFRNSEAALAMSRELQSSQIDVFEGRLADAEAKYRDSEAEQKILGARYAEQVAMAEGLSRRHSAVEDRMNEAEIELQESDAQRTVLVIQNSQHLATIDDLSSVVTTVERRLEEAKMKCQDLEVGRRALLEQCDELSARNMALDARLEETVARFHASEGQRKTIGTQYAEQRTATDALRAEIEVLKELLKGVETKSEAQRQNFANSEHILSTRVGTLEQTLAENERKLEESEARRQALVARNEEGLAAMQGHSGTVRKLEERLEEIQKKLEDSEVQRRALVEQCDECSVRALEGRPADTNRRLQAALEVIEKLREQMREEQADIDTLKRIVIEERAKGLERDKRGLTLKGWISRWILSYYGEMSQGFPSALPVLLLAFVVMAPGVVYNVYC